MVSCCSLCFWMYLFYSWSLCRFRQAVYLSYQRCFSWVLQVHKVYHCYFPINNRYYISANVTFFEETLYFSSSLDESHAILEVLLWSIPSPLPEPVTPIDSNEVSRGNSHTESSRCPLIIYYRRVQVTDPTLEEALNPNESWATPSTPILQTFPKAILIAHCS